MENPKAEFCSECNLYFCSHGIGGHRSYAHKDRENTFKVRKQVRKARTAQREALKNAKIVYRFKFGEEFSQENNSSRTKLNKIRDCFLGKRGDINELAEYEEIISTAQG